MSSNLILIMEKEFRILLHSIKKIRFRVSVVGATLLEILIWDKIDTLDRMIKGF